MYIVQKDRGVYEIVNGTKKESEVKCVVVWKEKNNKTKYFICTIVDKVHLHMFDSMQDSLRHVGMIEIDT
jgi:hypothetical protein